jgi:hypothetical protein
MITAVDTNILLDVPIPDASHAATSQRALAEGLRAGVVVISEPVYAELAPHLPDKMDLDRFLADTGSRSSSEPTPWSKPTGCSLETEPTTASTSPSWSGS